MSAFLGGGPFQPGGGGGGVTPAELAAAIAALELEIAAASAWLFPLGTGSLGDLSVVAGVTLTPGFYDDVSIGAAGNLNCDGMPVVARGVVDLNATGIIDAALAANRNASGVTAGTGRRTKYSVTSAGGNGGTGANPGSAGADFSGANGLCYGGGLGGTGGTGAGPQAGGVPGPTTNSTWALQGVTPVNILAGYTFRSTAITDNRNIAGGTGGGGGGGSAAGGVGGGGGSGTGVACVCAKQITGTGTIQAPGGNGGNAAAAGNGAGGAAGGGGAVALFSPSIAAGVQTNVAAGTPGTGFGTGTAGGAGVAGTVYRFDARAA